MYTFHSTFHMYGFFFITHILLGQRILLFYHERIVELHPKSTEIKISFLKERTSSSSQVDKSQKSLHTSFSQITTHALVQRPEDHVWNPGLPGSTPGCSIHPKVNQSLSLVFGWYTGTSLACGSRDQQSLKNWRITFRTLTVEFNLWIHGFTSSQENCRSQSIFAEISCSRANWFFSYSCL